MQAITDNIKSQRHTIELFLDGAWVEHDSVSHADDALLIAEEQGRKRRCDARVIFGCQVSELIVFSKTGGKVPTLPVKAFYRVDEITAHYRIPKSTIYRWIQFGRLPAVELSGGKDKRIPRAAVERMERDIFE